MDYYIRENLSYCGLTDAQLTSFTLGSISRLVLSDFHRKFLSVDIIEKVRSKITLVYVVDLRLIPRGLGLGLLCWRSYVRNSLPAKSKGLPFGLSSSHWACLVGLPLRCGLRAIHRIRSFALCTPKG